jgi:hypothetical protein
VLSSRTIARFGPRSPYEIRAQPVARANGGAEPRRGSSVTLGKKSAVTFPWKFKERLELKKTDIVLPAAAWITYAVCGCEEDACGWEGWILESVRRKIGKKKEELSIDSRQLCPKCGRDLFRTAVSLRFTPARSQVPDLIPGVDYRVGRMRYGKKKKPNQSLQPTAPSRRG